MEDNGAGGSLSEETICKRSDGRKWRCRLPAMPGKLFCYTHHQQSVYRQKHHPVPNDLKLVRAKTPKLIPKIEDEFTNSDPGVSNSAPKRGKRKRNEASNDVFEEKSTGISKIPPTKDVGSSVLPRKRAKRVIKEENLVESSEDLDEAVIRRIEMDLMRGYVQTDSEKEQEKPLVKELKHGRLEIAQPLPSFKTPKSARKAGTPVVKIGATASKSVPERTFRSKNVEPLPIATVQVLSSVKANIKSAAKNKKKCHWCRWGSYRVFVKCMTCKKQFFCEDCINERHHDKAAVKRECPVCLGTCPCRVCMKGKPKEVKPKEVVAYNPELVVDDCEVAGDDLEVAGEDREVVGEDREVVGEDREVIVVDDHEMIVDDHEVIAVDDREVIVVDDREVIVIDDHEVIVLDDSVVILDDHEVVINDSEPVVDNREKKFDKIMQLHVVRTLLPLLEEINQEKIIELDMEAKNKGKTQDQLYVQLAIDSQTQQCRFCKSWIVDAHRSCGDCSYFLCILCCQDFRDGFLHSNLEDLKNTRTVRSKSLSKISWKLSADGSIRCPPENLGGCGYGSLNLTSFSLFNWTKDLEASAEHIILKYKSMKPFDFSSSFCSLCEENEEIGSEKVGNLNKNKDLYFLTKQDCLDNNLEHFMKHWGKGQPLVIRDVLKSQPALSWDLGFMFCKYLEKSAESRKGEMGKLKNRSDWCEVQFGREQVFAGGKTHANAWKEFLKFKVRFSSGIFQDQFPNHYEAVMQALPFQEYINPLTGFLNLAVNLRDETQNPNLGPFVYISYGGSEDLMGAEFLTKLSYHAYDVVNILAHATDCPIPEKKLNEAKILMNKYNSQDHMKSFSKILTRNKLEELFGNSSGFEDDTNGGVNDDLHILSDDSSLEDEDLIQLEVGSSSRYAEEQILDTCGAEWDIFRREDVPKLVEYFRKYSKNLKKFNGSPKKIFHPIFDEIFYLESSDKAKLMEEFDVEPLSFEQSIGEAVFIPAGCPYQIKKTKSCVNVVLEFVSPESASECVKLNNEARQLPVNHKVKGKMLEVKKMAINGVHAAIEEIREVSQAEISGVR